MEMIGVLIKRLLISGFFRECFVFKSFLLISQLSEFLGDMNVLLD